VRLFDSRGQCQRSLDCVSESNRPCACLQDLGHHPTRVFGSKFRAITRAITHGRKSGDVCGRFSCSAWELLSTVFIPDTEEVTGSGTVGAAQTLGADFTGTGSGQA
jgi:hypothetical protein